MIGTDKKVSVRSKSFIVFGFLVIAVILPFLLFAGSIENISNRLLQTNSSTLIFSSVVFLLMFDVVLPIPSSIVCIAAATFLGVSLGTMSIFTGLILGGLLGYYLGVRVSRITGSNNSALFSDGKNQIRNLCILFLARPFPILAELSLIEAGISNLRLKYFLLVLISSSFCVAISYSLAVSAVLSMSDPALFSGVLIIVALLFSLVLVCLKNYKLEGGKND